MNLRLDRFQFTDEATIGRLYVDGTFSCYVLEDAVRFPKVYGKTAIPAGTYSIVAYPSPKFGREVLLLKNVPMFEMIEIHVGNDASDTLGCLLPGMTYGANWVSMSKMAEQSLFAKVKPALSRGEPVTITIN